MRRAEPTKAMTAGSDWQELDDHPNPDDPELVPVPGTRRPLEF